MAKIQKGGKLLFTPEEAVKAIQQDILPQGVIIEGDLDLSEIISSIKAGQSLYLQNFIVKGSFSFKRVVLLGFTSLLEIRNVTVTGNFTLGLSRNRGRVVVETIVGKRFNFKSDEPKNGSSEEISVTSPAAVEHEAQMAENEDIAMGLRGKGGK